MTARNRVLLIALVALGLALRSYHYLRGASVWQDEAAAVVNVLSHGFIELLGPLSFHEAAPPLFLWLEKAVSLTLGDGEYALRLPAFLVSCAAMILLAWVAARLLEPRPRRGPSCSSPFPCSSPGTPARQNPMLLTCWPRPCCRPCTSGLEINPCGCGCSCSRFPRRF